MTTYLCTIPFATSFLATFKSKFASPLEEPSNFTFPTDAALTQNFDGVALLVVAAEEVAVLLFKDWPLNDAHKLCMFAVDAVKDIFACVCIYFYCCFRTTKSDDDFSFFPSLSLHSQTTNTLLSLVLLLVFSFCLFSFFFVLVSLLGFFFGRHRISANFFPVSQKSWPKSVNFFFTASPKNRKYHLQKWCSFIRLSYLRLKFFVSKGVFIHKITSEGWQTIREGRARLWEP